MRSLTKHLGRILIPLAAIIFVPVSLAQDSETAQAEVDPSEHKFELAKEYFGDCANTDEAQFEQMRPYLKAFTDMEVMAEMMADPAEFMKLMVMVNDPRTIHVMSKCATEPVMWDTWMTGMTDFNKWSRAMTHFMNPNMYFAWMMASMNPATYQPMMKMTDPAYFNKWMTALANPTFYSPVTSLADPNWYAPRFAWMANPQSMQPIFNMMNMAWQPQTASSTETVQ